MSGRSKVLAPLATVVAVAAVAGTAALVSGGSGGPRVLRLADSGGVGTAATRDAAVAPGGGSSGYVLTGDLPAGEPADAPAWALPAGPGAQEPVARLAAALKTGAPQRDGDGWVAGTLRVDGHAGRPWYVSGCVMDTPVSSDGSSSGSSGVRVGCAIAVDGVAGSSGAGSSGSGTSSGSAGATTSTVAPKPVESPGTVSPDPAVPPSGTTVPLPTPVPVPLPLPPPPTPSEASVRAAAAPVLQAVGLDPTDAVVTTYPGGGSALVDPVVGGLATSGWATRVDVGPEGEVMGASGWLAVPDEGDSYPLVDARTAFDALPEQPRTLACPVGPDGQGCLPPEPTEVTGAKLGLSLAPLADEGAALLPSWLFDVKGSEQPVAAVAVEPRYLAQPEVPTPGASEPGTEPGTVDPAPPTADRRPVMIQAAEAGKGNELVVTYDNGGCGEKNVSGYTKEDASTVYVGLEADARRDGQACTDDYRPATLTLLLQAPLGDRKVVNANATQIEVPREAS